MDFIGIVILTVPIITPIGAKLGFSPVWFAMMVCITLQVGFLTPPFALAIFFVKGICKPEWGVETVDIIKGVLPFVGIVFILLLLCTVFPDLILWLPQQTIKPW
jgi:TRAP-type mannitol/chloroaromatic compound transport system permease large subunit